MNHLVSIVTQCYNGESYLGRFFESVLAQTYPRLELILIDDGSTDKSSEVVDSYRERLKNRNIDFTYCYQENAGQASALNRGLKLFNGDFLSWLDSDDEMFPECIKKKVRFLQEHQEYDFCMCRGIEFYEDSGTEGRIIERKNPSEAGSLMEDYIYIRNVSYTGMGYMVKTSSFDRIIPGREIYTGQGGQNVQILLPLAHYGKIGFMDDMLYRYHIRSTSHSHSIDNASKNIRQIENFEALLENTLMRMRDTSVSKYIPEFKSHYAGIKFGNAIDSKDPELIRKYYKVLKEYGHPSVKNWLIMQKYTNRILRGITVK